MVKLDEAWLSARQRHINQSKWAKLNLSKEWLLNKLNILKSCLILLRDVNMWYKIVKREKKALNCCQFNICEVISSEQQYNQYTKIHSVL